MEYWCMVDFVRNGYLGSRGGFSQRFDVPITEGQHEDSAHRAVELMKKRAWILFKRLRSVVQRRDASFLRHEIPAKREYVLTVRLAPVQRKLYQSYLKFFFGKSRRARVGKGKRTLEAWATLLKVWNHPFVLSEQQQQQQQSLATAADGLSTAGTAGTAGTASPPLHLQADKQQLHSEVLLDPLAGR
jgi:transcriptional regulator ATRX